MKYIMFMFKYTSELTNFQTNYQNNITWKFLTFLSVGSLSSLQEIISTISLYFKHHFQPDLYKRITHKNYQNTNKQ